MEKSRFSSFLSWVYTTSMDSRCSLLHLCGSVCRALSVFLLIGLYSSLFPIPVSILSPVYSSSSMCLGSIVSSRNSLNKKFGNQSCVVFFVILLNITMHDPHKPITPEDDKKIVAREKLSAEKKKGLTSSQQEWSCQNETSFIMQLQLPCPEYSSLFLLKIKLTCKSLLLVQSKRKVTPNMS